MFEITLLLLVFGIVAVGLVIVYFYEKYLTEKKVNQAIRDALVHSMAFLQIETVDKDDGQIYLAYNARSREFLGQASDEIDLMKNIFLRFPKYEMLWIQQQNQWVAVTKKELDEKLNLVV